MSVEDRLRGGLARNAEDFRPEVERRLTRAVARQRRRQRFRWAGAVAAAVMVLAVAAIGASVLGRDGPRRAELGKPTGPAGQPLTGTYSATVPASATATSKGVAGVWALTLRADGTMAVQAPTAYHGVLSGALFDSAADRFRTSLFTEDLCSGLGNGTYRWTRTGSTVTFTVTDDPCDGRVAVLTAAAWHQKS